MIGRRCEHLGDSDGVQASPLWGSVPTFSCRHPAHKQTTAAACLTCPHWHAAPNGRTCLPSAAPPAEPRHPQGVVVDRWGRDAGVSDLYYGASVFLVLGGPSIKALPLEKLAARGVCLMSCNNSCAVLPPPLRPHIWLHTDPCYKFHDSIWRDPSVLKFTPIREWGAGRGGKKKLRRRLPDGSAFEHWDAAAKDCPAVLGFQRNSGFSPENWLWEPSINRGNDKEHAEGMKDNKPNGWPHVINTMFAALRLAFYLGFRRVYLLGADFYMEETAPYAFGQDKSAGGIRANNWAFSKMDAMFAALVPKFAEVGFEVYNLNPESALLAFPHKSFDDALTEASGSFEQSLRCDGWYCHD